MKHKDTTIDNVHHQQCTKHKLQKWLINKFSSVRHVCRIKSADCVNHRSLIFVLPI